MRAQLVKEIRFSFPDQTGVLGKTGRALANAGISIRSMSNQPAGRTTTDTRIVIDGDLEKAKQILDENGAMNISEGNAVAVTVESKIGALAEIGERLSAHAINIGRLSVSEATGGESVVFITTNNDADAINALTD